MQPLSELHAEAQRLASNGVPVFPCLPDLKQPATPNGFHDASTDLDVINAWWTENPRYNIAFSPHTVGLGIVDLDGEEGFASWEKWQDENTRLAPTYTVRTPRGGVHLYYRGILPASQSKLGVHIDTRGVGSYALVPPSTFEGKSYTLLDSRAAVELDPSVGAFLEALKLAHVKAASGDLDEPQNVGRARKFLLDSVARGDVAVEGHMGDQFTFVISCKVMNLGVSEEMCAALMTELWNPHCVPPWDEDELACKVENAARYAQNEAGAWAAGSSAEAFGSVLDTLDLGEPEPEPEEEPAARPKRRRFRPWTLAELRNRPAPSWLVPDMFPAEGVSVLFGPPGSLKSYLAIGWSAELATLGTCVAYVAGEGASGIAQRAFAWQTAHGVDDNIPLYVIDEAPWAADDASKIEFIKELQALKPQLVVIDTLARTAVGLNENDAKDMGLMVAFLDAIKTTLHCAVLVVHHTGKEEGRGMRGSNALEGACDAAFQVSRNKGLRAVSVRCTRQKDAPEREEPWCYEGRDLGGQLVLQPVSFKDYSDLTRVQDTLQPVEIGRILRELSAVGVENGVSTNVLAYDMVNRASPELTEEARDTLVKRQEKVLAKLSRTKLEAYCTGVGPSLLWFLP